MYSSIYLIFGAMLAYYAVSRYIGLRSSIIAARRTGLPYVVLRKQHKEPPGLELPCRTCAH